MTPGACVMHSLYSIIVLLGKITGQGVTTQAPFHTSCAYLTTLTFVSRHIINPHHKTKANLTKATVAVTVGRTPLTTAQPGTQSGISTAEYWS